MIIPVILAGGSGSRLWPLSRESYPKQFIHLLNGESLFQQTLARVLDLAKTTSPIVVGNEQHRFLMAEQIRHSAFPNSTMILEPCFRGTAAAVALAAMQALKENQESLLLVLPSDHVVSDTKGFIQTIEAALPMAKQGKLVTLGVKPTQAQTGYGYIQKGALLSDERGYKIARFVEKPNQAMAQKYCESGEYWWNSGMFLFSAASFLQELMLLAPTIYENIRVAFDKAKQDVDFIRPSSVEFERCPTDSIDYAIMEKTHNGVVYALNSQWNDVGAWDALVDLYERDQNGNVCIGDVLFEQTTNSYIQADHRLVAAVGVDNLIIVETGDVVLVLDRNQAQAVKPLVGALKEKLRQEVIFHRKVERPWGAYESVDKGARFQVKRITVAVGGKLSLQRHRHRSEHWVVVQGLAKVTRGEEVFLLHENQSTYIPMGINHRLENAGNIPLEIIEVQSGDYLGEDDIERLEDQYGRERIEEFA